VHGIPGNQVLKDGDILSIDIGTTFEGYVSDTAATVALGNVSVEAKRLLRVTQEALMLGVAAMQQGNRLSDIGHAVQAHAEAHGYGVVRALVGHGVGTKMHEEPQVPNWGEAGRASCCAPARARHRTDDYRRHLRRRNPQGRVDGRDCGW
jgi:methionyl aminopeptidase